MAPSIGSMPWLDKENQQVAQFTAQEVEEFAFSVRNELDFLNEHMAEIFSKNQVNIANVFKTPGKLRGKTPRTARKRNALETRDPLNDIFAPNGQKIPSPTRAADRSREPRPFHVAKDAATPDVHRDLKLNKDYGYHGMTEDEMDIDEQDTSTGPRNLGFQEKTRHILPDAPAQNTQQPGEQSVLDGSFHSAEEDLAPEDSEKLTISRPNGPVFPQNQAPGMVKTTAERDSPQTQMRRADTVEDSEVVDKASLTDDEVEDDSMRSQSERSSPAVKGLVRKSSLTFANLPAREPLTTKKSIGVRLSRTGNVEAAKSVIGQGSFLGRITGGKSLGGSRQPEATVECHDHNELNIEESRQSTAGHGETDSDLRAAKLHNKSSTQRLHDRINMLGKSQPARPTKSIHATAQPTYPELILEPAIGDKPRRSSNLDEDEDDWIQPPSMQAKQSPRPHLSKSISADVMENLRGKINIGDEQFGRSSDGQRQPSRRHSLDSEHDLLNAVPSTQIMSGLVGSPLKTVQGSQIVPSTTPLGTPASTRNVDGPISASKSKLQSIMKTARGLFTSSAGASAQAKMELRNQAKLSSPNITSALKPTNQETVATLYPTLAVDSGKSPTKPAESQRTRGSIEKEKEEQERQRAEGELKNLRDEDNSGTATERGHGDQNAAIDERDGLPKDTPVEPPSLQQQPSPKSPRRVQSEQEAVTALEASGNKGQNSVIGRTIQAPSTSQQSQPQRAREVKRQVKPAKGLAQKPEPQRVAIRVGTLSQRMPLSNAALASGLQDSLPPPPSKPAGLTKKTSMASIQTSVSSSSMRSATASKPKALIAAEKKKEQDEKEAQRKLEQKRDIERRRALQQEDSRRQEQAQRAEAERQRERDRPAAIEDPKKMAHRQAIDKRRQDLAKKEQQRNPSVSQHQPPLTSRPELGGARLPSKLHAVQDYSRPPLNNAMSNPATALTKRVFESQGDGPVRHSRLPGGPPYQANDAKRRRTDDEALEESCQGSTMAPPKRQSNLLRGAQRPYGPSLMGPPPTITNGYSHAKPAMTSQTYQPQHPHQAQPTRQGPAPQDMAKYANGRIVFAENSNAAHSHHKTPNQARLTHQPLSKSSPQYVNGENIQLEDIATDTEDEDSDEETNKKAKGALLPSWVQSPVLNQLLREQEKHTDPDSIFGPSAAVNMEEMFKERHHRFRARTSSANWGGNDRLTEEEIQSDNAAREKMSRQGGWTYGL
ncbi:MAG: hypothetical protein Q9207_002627 [Kuettlingeria erythrocarpa]